MRSIDPSRTTTLQKSYARRLRREYNQLGTDIERWFADPNNWIREPYELDDLVTNAPGPSRWSFAPVAQVLGAFTKWITKRVGGGQIEVTSDGFISEAFGKGVDQATSAAAVPVSAAVSGAFRTGTTIERLKVLRATARNAINGVGEKIRSAVVDRLSLGLIRGESPRQVARDINKSTRKIGKVAATRIARTEVIRAHAEGALDRMEAMGVTHVGANVEFLATKMPDGSFEKRVCPKCRALDGVVFPIERAHGIIPVHPNCRCVWLPRFVEVDKTKIRAAVTKAVKSSQPKKKKSQDVPATAAQKSKDDWPGPAIKDYLKS